MILTDAHIKILIDAIDYAVDQVRGDEQKAFLEVREVLAWEVGE